MHSLTPLPTDAPVSPEFTIAREFDAPVAKVWASYTRLEHLMQWWGPKGFRMLPESTMDLREGGAFHYGMLDPGGSEMWGRWIFREIVPEQRLTMVTSFSDRSGGITRHPMAPDWPAEMLSTAWFEPIGARTRITLKVVAIRASEREIAMFVGGFDSMNGGFGGTFDVFSAYLARS